MILYAISLNSVNVEACTPQEWEHITP